MHNSRAHRLILFFCLLFACIRVSAQDTLSQASVDEKSYRLYTNKNWAELIIYGNTALAKGIDYYYLRMRIGTAYYENKNYVKAAHNFEKALKFNSGDADALEYLYYCYIYTNQFEQARWLSKSFSKGVAKEMKTDSLAGVSFILFEGGVRTSDSSTEFKPGYYGQLGLEHYIAKRFTLFHAVTYYNQKDFEGATSQFQYYLRGNIPLKNDWEIAPAFQYINRAYTPPPPLKIPPKRGQPPPADTIPPTTYYNYFIGSLAIKKTVSHIDFTLGTTLSKVYGNTQSLNYLTINYYPFGWNKLDIGTTLYTHTENSYSSTYFAYNPYISWQIVKPLSLTVSYLNNGNGANIIEYNGFIVNNSTDLTTSRISGLLTVSAGRHLDIYGAYQYSKQTQSTEGFIYHYNSFILGLIIKP